MTTAVKQRTVSPLSDALRPRYPDIVHPPPYEAPAAIEPAVAKPKKVITRNSDTAAHLALQQRRCMGRSFRTAVGQMSLDRPHHLVGINIGGNDEVGWCGI